MVSLSTSSVASLSAPLSLVVNAPVASAVIAPAVISATEIPDVGPSTTSAAVSSLKRVRTDVDSGQKKSKTKSKDEKPFSMFYSNILYI